jgi:hypothetical protein
VRAGLTEQQPWRRQTPSGGRRTEHRSSRHRQQHEHRPISSWCDRAMSVSCCCRAFAFDPRGRCLLLGPGDSRSLSVDGGRGSRCNSERLFLCSLRVEGTSPRHGTAKHAARETSTFTWDQPMGVNANQWKFHVSDLRCVSK